MLRAMTIQHHEEPGKAIVTPSALSVGVTLLLTLALAVLATYVIWFHSSDIGRYFSRGLEIQLTTSAPDISAIRDAVDSSEEAANFSVFMFWFLTAGLCYAGVTTLWHGFVAMRWNLDSVITQSYSGKFSTLVEIAARTGLRLGGLLLIALAYSLLKTAAPWFAFWLYTMSHTRLTLFDIVIFCGVIMIVFGIVHLVTVGLRLLTLRVRLLS